MLRPVSRTTFLSLCGRPSNLSTVSLRPFVSLTSSSSSFRTPPFHSTTTQFRLFTSSAEPNADRLTWDEFLRLRRQRRLTGLLASIPTSAAGIYFGLEYFGSGEIDPTQTIMGFDPFIMHAAFVMGCGILGWLVGPTIGRSVWHLLHRRKTHLISLRESQFYKHIEKNRADPSFQSYSNPVPDYYGEKIGSLKDYRRWLKDQKAYRKKAQTFL